MKQTIAIDIDDVISDTTEAMRVWGNKVTGVELTPEQYSVPGNDYWGYYERIWAEHGVEDRLKYDDFEAELIKDQTRVPLVASASLVIEELQKRFHIILLTSRNPALEAGTRKWLKDNLKGDIKLYFAKNGRINAGRSKGELCKELGAFMLIDDNVEHCQSAIDNGVEAIIFGEYGWQNAVVEGAVKCRDWPAVLEYFDGREPNSEKTFRIGLDFDDVLISSADQSLKIHNSLYGTQLTRDNWYDDPSVIAPWKAANFSEIVKRVVDIQQMDDFAEVLPLEGALTVLRRLKKLGHTSIVITGRPAVLHQQTLGLMNKYYPGIFEPGALYFTDHFDHEEKRLNKGDIAVQLKLTHFVDDVISHANNVASKGVKTILFGEDYKWNQADPDAGVVRLGNWKEVGEYFDAEAA